jgi:hypothetical protein
MRTGPFLVTAALLVALAGCVPTGGHPSESPSATASPVFASDAEALAAAEKAYAAYLKVSDQIFIDGGKSPERLLDVATKSLYSTELDGFQTAAQKGWHSTGGSKADNFSLESYNAEDRSSIVTVYLCSDVSAVDVRDATGASVVSPNRPARTPFEVTFAYKRGAVADLVVATKEVWTGGGIC